MQERVIKKLVALDFLQVADKLVRDFHIEPRRDVFVNLDVAFQVFLVQDKGYMTTSWQPKAFPKRKSNPGSRDD